MMKKATIAIVVAIVCSRSGLPSSNPTPRSEDYPAKEAYQGRNAPVILSKNDQVYRTQLQHAATDKPNFSNHYILTALGCGAECLAIALIDANTGRVYWAPFTVCCWGPEKFLDTFQPIEARSDSRLIIFRGERNEKDGDNGTHYYEFDGRRFTEIAVRK